MPTNACSKPSTNNYVADLGEGPARTSYLQNRKAKRAGQRELCQKFVSVPPRKALAVVSRPVPLPSSPVAPADYHFRYLLLIGEKERLRLLPLLFRLQLRPLLAMAGSLAERSGFAARFSDACNGASSSS